MRLRSFHRTEPDQAPISPEESPMSASSPAHETDQQRADRLKLANRGTSKHGDLITHDAHVARLLDVLQRRIEVAGDIHREHGPLALELRLAIADAETALALLKEVAL